MEITEELLKTIYQRVTEVMLAKHNQTPSKVSILEEGTIFVEVDKYARGPYTDEYYLSPDELTANLDELIRIRLENERIAAEKAAKEREEREEKQRLQKEKEEKELYYKLHKKYGNFLKV